MSEPAGVIWLRLRPEKLAASQNFESSIKKPLFAASFSFRQFIVAKSSRDDFSAGGSKLATDAFPEGMQTHQSSRDDFSAGGSKLATDAFPEGMQTHQSSRDDFSVGGSRLATDAFPEGMRTQQSSRDDSSIQFGTIDTQHFHPPPLTMKPTDALNASLKFRVECEALIRLPLKGAIRYQSFTETNGFNSLDLVEFDTYEDLESLSKVAKTWRGERASSGAAATTKSPAPDFRDNEAKSCDSPPRTKLARTKGETRHVTNLDAKLPAPVLSPLQLPAALQSSWSDTAVEYRGIIVTGSHLTAVRLRRQPGGTPARVKLTGNVKSVEASSELVSWETLNWEKSNALEITWNPKTHAPLGFAFHLPIIGKIEIQT